MSGRSVILAVEDSLSEAVSTKILEGLDIDISQRLGFQGKGYLQNKALSLNQTALGFPVFMLVDQDTPSQCPPQLAQEWTKGRRSAKFFLRVAVMEVESWVMADRGAFADFLSIPLHKVPEDTDVIPKPKEFLVNLARLSKKTRLRQEIVPLPGATSKVGTEYNSRLGEFVHNCWNVNRAASASASLQRTLAQLSSFDIA
jgi:hypothetical protein